MLQRIEVRARLEAGWLWGALAEPTTTPASTCRVTLTAVSTSFTSSSRSMVEDAAHRQAFLFSPPSWTCWRPSCDSGGLLYFKSDVQEHGELVCCFLSRVMKPWAQRLRHSPGASVRFAPTHRERWCQVHGSRFVLFRAQLRGAGGAVRPPLDDSVQMSTPIRSVVP
jgi:hypothetical protein